MIFLLDQQFPNPKMKITIFPKFFFNNLLDTGL